MVKVVVLGGSGVATPELAQALHDTVGRTQVIDLVLHGRSADKLELVTGASRLLAEADPLLQVRCTTDLADALDGAAYVLSQVRVGGLQARAFDETFPFELGIPGEETVGAGGFANASRTVPVVLDLMRQVETYCPQAVVLTFANPSSVVQYAINRYTRLQVIGMCDAPVTLVGNIARALGVEPGALLVDYQGMHHFGWVTGVWLEGRDVFPDVLARAAEINPNVETGLVQSLGVLPGSYLNFFFHADRVLAKKRSPRTRAEELIDLQNELLAEYAACLANEGQVTAGQVTIQTKPTGLAKRRAIWYRVVIAPVLLALVEGRLLPPGRSGAGYIPENLAWPAQRFILNVPNRGLLPWLPQDAIVEVPTMIENGSLHPLAVPDRLPVDIRALVQANCAYEMLAAEAIVERDQGKALRALTLHPMVRSYDQAVRVLEKAWALQ